MSGAQFAWQYLGELWPILRAYGAAIAAGVIVCTTIAFSVGVKLEHDRCVAAQARAERAAAVRDALEAEAAAGEAAERLEQITAESNATREKFDAFKTELAKHRVNACRLTPAIRRGLRLPGDRADAEICGPVAAGAEAHDAGACAAHDRDAIDTLADTRAALAEANARLAATRAWYEGVRKRYGAARLR